MYSAEVAKQLARLEKDLLEMKSSQPIGSNSVRSYEILSNFVWDYDYTISAEDFNGFSYSHSFRVRYIADNQQAPFASIRFMAQVNNIKYNPLTPQSNFVIPGVTSGTDNAYIRIGEDIFTNPDLTEYALDNVIDWRVELLPGSLGTNFKLKFIINATDTGRIEIRPFSVTG